jgi:hypothetical protein
MEKTIIIDEKAVRLKSTAGTMKRYKAQFQKDYFAELMKIAKTMNNSNGQAFDLGNISYEDLDHLDFEPLYNFIWVLAKTADPTIPDPVTWLDQFEAMPIAEVFPQIVDLLESSIQSKKKPKK